MATKKKQDLRVELQRMNSFSYDFIFITSCLS